MSLGKPQQLLFVPDTELGTRLAEAHSCPTIDSYSSGRPAIVGDAEPTRSTRADMSGKIMLGFGTVPSTFPPSVRASLQAARRGSDVDTSEIPGSLVLTIRVADTVRVQGTISCLHQVFWATVDGQVVAATDARLLAELAGTAVDANILTTWTLSPQAPYPFGLQPPWKDMHVVPPGHCLIFNTDGTHPCIEQYWCPPAPDRDAQESRDRLRERMIEAVRVRAERSDALSCDASGGIDSSVVLALAARERNDTTAFTTGPAALFDEETSWARVIVDATGVERWKTAGPDSFPHVFDRIDETLLRTDLPFAGEPVKMRSRFIAEAVSAATSGTVTTHLTGHFGDELFSSGVAHLRDLGLRRPLEVRKRVELLHARTRIPRRTLMKWATSRSSYHQSLQDFVRDGHTAPGWLSMESSIPPWVHYREETRERLGSQLEHATVSPLGTTAEQHETLSRLITSGSILRHESQIMAPAGIFVDAPFGDDRVVDAVLRSPIGKLQDPSRVKPVLLDAIGDELPQAIVNRTAKTDSTAAIWTGLTQNASRLRTMSTNMLAAQRGVVDEGMFRASLLGPHPPSLLPMSLWRTLAVEAWLRDNEGVRHQISVDPIGVNHP